MKVTPETVEISVEFSHPTYLRLLHHLDDDRDVDEWLKTLAWVQMAQDIERFDAPVIADLPEDVQTQIELYQQHREQSDSEAHIGDAISEFVNIDFSELIDMNDLADADDE
jgi:hypothetical protein